MTKNHFRIIIPFTSTQDIELVTRLLDKKMDATIANPQIEFQQEATNGSHIRICSQDYQEREEIPDDVLQIISKTQQVFSRILSTNDTFMIASPTGFQVVKASEIVCFEYLTTKKYWKVVLTDNTILQLRRNTGASDILKYSSTFVKISHQHIINLEHLKAIDGTTCKLTTCPTAHTNELRISRTCMKSIQQHFRMV